MTKPSPLRRVICTLVLALLPSQMVASDANHITLEILPGWRDSDGTHKAGFKLSMDPGWVTYWRVPGEAGIPPRFSFSGSENVETAEFSWPRPLVETKYDMKSFVYRDEVVIPLSLRLNDPAGVAHLKGDLEVGVCDDICIPVQFSFDVKLPAQTTASSAQIKASLNAVAGKSSSAATCAFTPKPDGMGIEIRAKSGTLGGAEHAVVEHRDQSLWVSPAKLNRDGNTLRIMTEISDNNQIPSGLQRNDLRITLVGEKEMVEFNGCTSVQ